MSTGTVEKMQTAEKSERPGAESCACEGAGPPRLWGPKDVCQYLGMSRTRLFVALRLAPTEPGSIPHVRLGRNPRFIPADMEAWAAANFPPAATFEAWRSIHRAIA